MIKVLVVDDHNLVRVGTCRLLADVEGIDIVADAKSGEEAISKVQKHHPDVVLMDVNMPGIGGLEATRRCLRVDPELKVIIVSVYDQEPYPSQLMSIGACGYLTKRASVDEIIVAIEDVTKGKRYLSAEIARHMALHPYSSDDMNPFGVLSSRELQICIKVTEGEPVPEISEALSLSPKTVNSYRYRIFEKLGVKNDVALTKLAIKHGIIESGALIRNLG